MPTTAVGWTKASGLVTASCAAGGLNSPWMRANAREGVVDPEEVQAAPALGLVGHDDRAGVAGSQVPPVPRVGEEGDVSRTRVLDGRHPLDGHVRVADHPSADQLGEVRERFA